MYFAYILYSATIEQYYCGQTNNLQLRLDDHNSGSTLSNKHGIPWVLVGFINCETRSEAMILEKKIKKRGIKRWLGNNRHLLVTSIWFLNTGWNQLRHTAWLNRRTTLKLYRGFSRLWRTPSPQVNSALFSCISPIYSIAPLLNSIIAAKQIIFSFV